MDIIFILLGISIFLAAAASFSIDHYRRNPAQAVVSFFIPPFAWWIYSHYWLRSKKTVYVQVLAVLLILLGIFMPLWSPLLNTNVDFKKVIAQNDKKVQTFNPLTYPGSNEALTDLSKAERKSDMLNGKIHGQNFMFDDDVDTAEFDENGTLHIKKGTEFFGRFEVIIEFNHQPQFSSEQWFKTVRALDKDAPSIFVSWYEEGNNQIQTKKYQSNYDLDFTLGFEEYNRFTGKLQLVLPDSDKTFLIGRFPVYNNALRFHGEGLIKTHNSTATLELLATKTLSTSYSKHIQEILGYHNTELSYISTSDEATSTVFIRDTKNVIRKIPLTMYRNDEGWFLAINGLGDALKANDNIVSNIPNNLKPALVTVPNVVGQVKPLKTLTAAQPANVQSVMETTSQTKLKSPTEKSALANIDKSEATTQQNAKPVTASQYSNDVLEINTGSAEETIIEQLQVLLNQELQLTTTEGKSKSGLFVGIHRGELILEQEVGGGMIEFLTEFRNIKTLKPKSPANDLPNQVIFTHPVVQ